MCIKELINYYGIIEDNKGGKLDYKFNMDSTGEGGSYIYLKDLEDKNEMKKIYDLFSRFLERMGSDYYCVSDHHATQYHNALMMKALLGRELNA